MGEPCYGRILHDSTYNLTLCGGHFKRKAEDKNPGTKANGNIDSQAANLGNKGELIIPLVWSTRHTI